MGQDEDATVRDLKGHQVVLLPLVARHGGHVIDTAGDGILAEFPGVVGATRCAVDIQAVMAARNGGVPEHRRMLFRIGINLGDVIHDETRIYGDGINVAARLEALAEPAGVFVSRAVYEQVRDRLDLAFEDLGEIELKNIARPVRAYRIAARAAPAATVGVGNALAIPDKPSIVVLPFVNMSGDAEQRFAVAERLDPLSPDIVHVWHGRGVAHYFARRFEEMITLERRAIAAKPEHAAQRTYLLAALVEIGEIASARAEAADTLRRAGIPE